MSRTISFFLFCTIFIFVLAQSATDTNTAVVTTSRLTSLEENVVNDDAAIDENVATIAEENEYEPYTVNGYNTLTHEALPIFSPNGFLMYSTTKIRSHRISVRTAVKSAFGRTLSRTNKKIQGFQSMY